MNIRLDHTGVRIHMRSLVVHDRLGHPVVVLLFKAVGPNGVFRSWKEAYTRTGEDDRSGRHNEEITMVQAPARSTIMGEYEERFAGSKALYSRAQSTVPSGVTHDGRYMKPFPLYVNRASGANKWDVDGHQFIDYAMGHGALILGHGDPDVIAAVHAQLDRGTHYGAGHATEVAWAEQVSKLIPSADRVRFTGSGTEANMLAMRIARIFTGRNTILKFEGHFHGWNDYLVKGEKPPFENTSVPGVPDEVLRTVAVVPSDDTSAVEERLAQGDVAAIIIEPSGASWTTIPLPEQFLAKLREFGDGVGCGADLRRGDHGLSLVAGWRTTAVQCHTGHDDAGKDRGGRLAGWSGHRQGRDHGPPGLQGSAGLERAEEDHSPRNFQRKPAHRDRRIYGPQEMRKPCGSRALRCACQNSFESAQPDSRSMPFQARRG